MNEEQKKHYSVLVIDDHKMVVIGIKLLIVDKFRAFYQAGNGAAGIQLARQHQPDLVIVDHVLPDISGDMVAKEIRESCPHTRILGYSFNMNAAAVLKMVDAGIHGYVDKSGTDAEFTRAVTALLEGREYFSKDARQHIIRGAASGEDHSASITANAGFTSEEIDIIRLIARQKKVRDISREMQLPETIVEQTVAAISRRIGARDTTDIIKFAIQQGIIRLGDL